MSDDASLNTGTGGTGNVVGDGGISKPTWIEQLPEAMRSDESLYNYKTIGDVVKALKESSAGREGLVRVPGEKSTSEEKAAFLKAIGMPDSVDAYEIKRPTDLPNEFFFDETAMKGFREAFYNLGIPPAKAQELVNLYYKNLTKQVSDVNSSIDGQIQKDLEEATTNLKTRWGVNFDNNNVIAQRTVDKMSELVDVKNLTNGLSLVDYFKREGPQNDPVIMAILHFVGTKVMDDSDVIAQGRGGLDDSDEAKAQRMFPSMKKK